MSNLFLVGIVGMVVCIPLMIIKWNTQAGAWSMLGAICCCALTLGTVLDGFRDGNLTQLAVSICVLTALIGGGSIIESGKLKPNQVAIQNGKAAYPGTSFNPFAAKKMTVDEWESLQKAKQRIEALQNQG